MYFYQITLIKFRGISSPILVIFYKQTDEKKKTIHNKYLNELISSWILVDVYRSVVFDAALASQKIYGFQCSSFDRWLNTIW